MAYYTDFDISNNSPEVIEAIKDISEYSDFYGIKWFMWEEDMKKVSKLFPDLVLEVSGNGEEEGDIWQAYFKNGKMQYCKAIITFEPFDESKLK